MHNRIGLPIAWDGQRVIGRDNVGNLKPDKQYPKDPMSSSQPLPVPYRQVGAEAPLISTSL